MKLFRPCVMALVVALAACGDGLKSPDFTPVNTLVSLEVLPAVAGQGNEIPAGTSKSYQAWANYTQTVPPGTPGAVDNRIPIREDVTGDAVWSSENSAIASVASGVVNGLVANPSPVTITAAFEGLTDTVDVTVTGAVAEGVDHVKPAGFPRSTSDKYTIAAGASTDFEIYARFSDDQVRQLTGSNYVVNWSSSDETVADNPAGDQKFNGVAIGTADITGLVTQPSGLTPASETATVDVRALSELCLSEFLAPAAVAQEGTPSMGCEQQCGVADPGNMIDGDEATFAALSIPLGLLTLSSIPAEVYDLTAQRLVVGQSAGFVISKPLAAIVAASLLPNIKIDTLNCSGDPVSCAVVETFAGLDSTSPLYLDLLGLIGDDSAALVQTGALTQPANGMRITFDGGLLSALAVLNVNTACATVAPLQ